MKLWRIGSLAMVSTPVSVFVAASILACVLVGTTVGATAAPALAPGAAATASEPGVDWLPASAQLVLRIRFAEARSSLLFRRLMSSKPMFGEEMAPLDRFATAAGVDLLRDADVAWIATDGGAGGESVAVLSARLDPKTLAERLEGKAASKTTYEGTVLYALAKTRTDRAAGPGSGAGAGAGTAAAAGGSSSGSHGNAAPSGTVVALPRAGSTIVGSSAWVRMALDRMAGRGQGIGASAHVGPLIAKRDEGATIWSAAGTRAIARKLESEWDSGQLDAEDLQSIRYLTASFRITSDVRFDSEATTATGEDADLLAITLRGLIAVGGLRAAASDPEMADLLRGLNVDRTANGVRLRGVIPAAVVSR